MIFEMLDTYTFTPVFASDDSLYGSGQKVPIALDNLKVLPWQHTFLQDLSIVVGTFSGLGCL